MNFVILQPEVVEIIVEEGGEKDEQGKVKKTEEAEEGKDEGKENVKKDKKVEGSKKDEDIISVKESDDNASQHTEVIDDSSEMEVGTKYQCTYIPILIPVSANQSHALALGFQVKKLIIFMVHVQWVPRKSYTLDLKFNLSLNSGPGKISEWPWKRAQHSISGNEVAGHIAVPPHFYYSQRPIEKGGIK